MTAPHAATFDELLRRVRATPKLQRAFTKWLEELIDDDADYAEAIADEEVYRDYFTDWLRDEESITVRDDGILEVWCLSAGWTPDLVRDMRVMFYHHTSSVFVPTILEEGLSGDVAYEESEGQTGLVYLTTEYDGPAVRGYGRRAAALHGGHPTMIGVWMYPSDLEPDPDDEDLSCGRYQFVVDFVPPDRIVEVDGEAPRVVGRVVGARTGDWVMAYHVTPNALLPLITVEGLRPAPHAHLGDGEVALFVEPELEGVLPYYDPHTTTVLRFRTPGFSQTEDGEDVLFGGPWPGPNDPPSPPFEGEPGAMGVIPPSAIDRMVGPPDNPGWRPLTLSQKWYRESASGPSGVGGRIPRNLPKIGAIPGFVILGNRVPNPMYITAWDEETGERVGRLQLHATRKGGEDWLSVGEVDVVRPYRRQGIATAMYRAAITAMDAPFAGLLSYLPDREKRLASLYRRLGAVTHSASEDYEAVRRPTVEGRSTSAAGRTGEMYQQHPFRTRVVDPGQLAIVREQVPIENHLTVWAAAVDNHPALLSEEIHRLGIELWESAEGVEVGNYLRRLPLGHTEVDLVPVATADADYPDVRKAYISLQRSLSEGSYVDALGDLVQLEVATRWKSITTTDFVTAELPGNTTGAGPLQWALTQTLEAALHREDRQYEIELWYRAPRDVLPGFEEPSLYQVLDFARSAASVFEGTEAQCAAWIQMRQETLPDGSERYGMTEQLAIFDDGRGWRAVSEVWTPLEFVQHASAIKRQHFVPAVARTEVFVELVERLAGRLRYWGATGRPVTGNRDYETLLENLLSPKPQRVQPSDLARARPQDLLGLVPPPNLRGAQIEPHQFLYELPCHQALLCTVAAVRRAFEAFASDPLLDEPLFGDGQTKTRRAVCLDVFRVADQVIRDGSASAALLRSIAEEEPSLAVGTGEEDNPATLMLFGVSLLAQGVTRLISGTGSPVLRQIAEEGARPVRCPVSLGIAASFALASLAGHTVYTHAPGNSTLTPLHNRIIQEWWSECRGRLAFLGASSASVTGSRPNYERPDADDVAEWTCGECHCFAIALHDLTQWPILAVVDSPYYDPGVCHFVVEHPSGALVDAAGVRPRRDFFVDYAPDELVHMTPRVIRREAPNLHMEPVEDEVIAEAREFILQHPTWYGLPPTEAGKGLVGARGDYEALFDQLSTPSSRKSGYFPAPRRDPWPDIITVDTPKKIQRLLGHFRSRWALMRVVQVGLRMTRDTLNELPLFSSLRGAPPDPVFEWLHLADEAMTLRLKGVRFAKSPMEAFMRRDPVNYTRVLEDALAPQATSYDILAAVGARWIAGIRDAGRFWLITMAHGRPPIGMWRDAAYSWAWLSSHPDLYWLLGHPFPRVTTAAADFITDDTYGERGFNPRYVAPGLGRRGRVSMGSGHESYASIFDPHDPYGSIPDLPAHGLAEVPQNELFTARASEWWAQVRGIFPVTRPVGLEIEGPLQKRRVR